MKKNNKLDRYLQSKFLFSFVLLINILLISVTKFYPSMDGAAHLYNSNVIAELIKGSDLFSKFYSLNTLPIPNWTSHFILALFNFFLPAWVAEKILLIIYVSGMALSFRFLIKIIKPENISLSIFIFPFIYSFLFHLGFYNFSLSFILYFATLAFWLRIYQKSDIKNYLVLFLLITIAYFTNVLIVGFLGLTIGFYIIYFAFTKYPKDFAVKFALKKMLLLLLVSLPSIIFFIIFYKNITFFPSTENYSVEELIKWLNDARSLIVYNYPGEQIITEQFFHLIILLIAFSFFEKKKPGNRKLINWFGKGDIMLIPLSVALVLYFIIPNGSSAGMMSDRYCMIIFIFLLLWTVVRAVPSNLNKIIIVLFLGLHLGLLIKHLNGNLRELNNHAITINEANDYLIDNSIVLTVNLSDSWIEPHFSNYLGVDKPLIILENYEAGVGWFPVKWNYDKMPELILGNKKSIDGVQWVTGKHSTEIQQIDNVLLYGNLNKIIEKEWLELNEVLSDHYKLIYKSEDDYVMLYGKK
ncbi:MAG: hypothetical protein ABFS35_21940 [Bacteroidota bacterium]